MPTYEYACRACGHRFDIVQKMSDDPLVICPECGGELRKVFTAPAISFKGSGFYATDHGKKSKGGSDKGGPSSDRGDSGDKTEKKSGAGDKGEKKTETASTSERSVGSGSKDTKKPSTPRKEDS
jgi:putative FmdB family regulatory protein